jgi:hypothetical protein
VSGIARRLGVSGLCITVGALLTSAACGRNNVAQTGVPSTGTPATQGAPASRPMGGAKSVTTFFVTSKGIGRGGDLGGLTGADAHCEALATAEGAGDHTWHAYLSTSATTAGPAVNARDRIGAGPWYNALGDRIAVNIAELHSGKNGINQENAVTERGDPVTGDGLDILTGSRSDGTAFEASDHVTCNNWTSSSAGRAQLGRLDRPGKERRGESWNSARHSRGCSQGDLRAIGAAGLFYCFAIE